MMRAMALALLLAGCSSAPAPRDRADEIADAVRANRAWKSDAERDEAIKVLCEKAQRRHADALFLLIERENAATAFAAIAVLAPLLAPEDLPRIEELLSRGDPSRALFLLRQSGFRAAAPLLEKHAKKLLDPAKKDLAKVALGALGALSVRGATSAILDYYASDPAASLRALGRMWEQKLDAPPLPRQDELTRQSLYLLAHTDAMGGDSAEACEAMLRVMTGKELDEFLLKHAEDRFAARGAFALACARDTFDPKKGAIVHRALLASPDPDLVAFILWSSPHKLDAGRMLADGRDAKLRGLPDARVCDYAAARLEADAVKKQIELPPSKADRDALVKKWRDKQPQ